MLVSKRGIRIHRPRGAHAGRPKRYTPRMCGRFKLDTDWSEIVRIYRIDIHPDDRTLQVHLPWAQVRPTQVAPVITGLPGSRVAWPARWGFPATWLARDGKDPWSRPLFNTVSEEAPAKPTWRAAFRERRCLVPTTGFVEWLTRGKAKYPVRFFTAAAEGGPTALAGVFGRFSRDGEDVDCFSILTTTPNGLLRHVHDRMPVVLRPEDWDTWLDPRTPMPEVQRLCAPLADGVLAAEPLPLGFNRPDDPAAEAAPLDWSLDEVAPDVAAASAAK